MAPNPVTVSARAIALLIVLAAASEVANGQAGEYQDRRRAAGTTAAQRLAAFGNWCRGRSYRALAKEQYETALRWDPEEPTARAGLGHVKSGDAWKPPSKRDTLLDAPTPTLPGAAMLENESNAAYAVGAEAFAGLAAWCDQAGLGEEARDAWETVLWFDPANGPAREALGLAESDTGWLKPADSGPAAFRARCRGLGPSATRMPGRTGSDDYTAREEHGFTLTEETRFTARSTAITPDSQEIVASLFRMEALLQGLRLIPERERGDGVQFRFIAVRSKYEYESAIESHPTWNQKQKDGNKTYGGIWWDPVSFLSWGHTKERLLDTAVHQGSHRLLQAAFPIPKSGLPAWFAEGVSYLASTAVEGTASSWCVNPEGSAFRKELPDDADWDEAVRKLLRRGEAPPLSGLARADLNALSVEGLVKARSVVCWLLSGSPAGLHGYLGHLKAGAAPDTAMSRAFGCPVEAIDRRWSHWARRP
jgi:tetratricopeptide (TPR) repeat protein